MKQVDAILTSDFHLRLDVPVSRTDDFWNNQWRKVAFIRDLQRKYNCPVLHAGDLFDYWKTSPFLLATTMHYLPEEFYTLYGNHDLPQHNLELKYKTGINVLEKAGFLKVLDCCHWDKSPDRASFEIKGRKILIWHYFTFQVGNKDTFMSSVGKTSNYVLRKYRQFDLIVTGDNHQSFVETLNGRVLVNPGSLMRQTAKQIDFKPKVYLYNAEENKVEAVELPIQKGVISLEHLEYIRKKDERIEAFVESLTKDWQVGLNYEDNLRIFFAKDKTEESIQKIILNTF